MEQFKSEMKQKERILLEMMVIVTLMLCIAFQSKAYAHTETLAVSSGQDIRESLREVFNKYGGNASDPLVVIIPAGTYSCSGGISLPNYVTIQMTDVTIKRGWSGGNFLRFGKKAEYPNNGYSGYEGFTNITIEGGTFDNNFKEGEILQGAHAQNLTFKNVTFKNVKQQHHIELAGVKNVVFDGCVFTGFSATSAYNKSKSNCEALSFDILSSVGADHFNTWPKNDETPCTNITVKNCTFSGVHRGVGTHSGLQGCYFSNCNISNNTFTNIIGTAILVTNYDNCVISDNTITNCGAGISYRTMEYSHVNYYMSTRGKKTKTAMNSRITNNKITITKTKFPFDSYGIQLFGEKLSSSVKGKNAKAPVKKGDYRMSGMTVTGNTITMNNKGNAIELSGVMKSSVNNNQITFNKKKAKGMTKGNGVVKKKQCSSVKTSGNKVTIKK